MSWRNKDTDLFKLWVKKHRIGPSMNDKYMSTRNKTPCPELYTGRDGTVGDGWLGILDSLATDLIKMGWDRDLHQVKEKFAGLRFYIGASTPQMDARIARAEEASYLVCENCGVPGEKSIVGHWILTLCKPCHLLREED